MLIGIDASRANNVHKTGTEWYAWHLIQALKKLDRQNQFVLYSREKLRGQLGELPANFQAKILSWPFRLWTQLRLSWEMFWHQPDVLLVPAHTIPIIHPKKTITTLHDIGFVKYPELYSKKELAYHNWAVMYALKKAQIVLTISKFSQREIEESYHLGQARVKLVYLGYDQEQFRPDLDQEKIKEVLIKYDIQQPYFFYIGRLEKKKNVLGLVKAFNKLITSDDQGEIKLVLAGQPGLGYNEIKEVIEKNNLNDKIIRLGWVDQADVPYLMAGALALVMPSFYEGFGLPVLEALACGTPVIGANSTAIQEIVAGAALLVGPNDMAKLAEAMAKIINNEELRQELAAAGLKRAQDFSWEKCARETLEIIQSI